MILSLWRSILLVGGSWAVLAHQSYAADVAFTTYAFPATSEPTSRTLPARLAEIANVRDFGATGNGVTDDLAAIMAAYNHGQITLVATAPSSGNVMTFASVPASIRPFHTFAIDVTNPTAFTGGDSIINSKTATTITVGHITGSVAAGDTVTINLYERGIIYFPPGTYYVSAPIDISPQEDGNGQTILNFLGEMGASTIIGNFADYIIKRGLSTNGNSFGGGRTVEKLTFINQHASGGGIRIGACVGGSIRDCDITANFGINTVNSDTPFTDGGNTFYAGSLEISIENCNLRAYNALASNSFGIARSADGPTTNCTFKDFDTGVRNFAGQGCMSYQGCYFEANNYGLANSWAPGHAIQEGPVACGFVTAFGCYFKNNGIGIIGNANKTAYGGILIEAAAGTIAGNPQYGVYIPGQSFYQHSLFSGIRITGEYAVAGFAITGDTLTITVSIDGVYVSNTGSGVNWVLPTIAADAYLTGCNVAPVYTMAKLPAFPISITAASWSAGTTTLQLNFAVSGVYNTTNAILVSGVTPSGYNGVFTDVALVNFNTISYSQTNPGSPTGSGGTIMYNVAHAAREGDCFNVSDADVSTWGGNPIGGGSTHAKVRWNDSATEWTVVGK